MHYGYDCLYYRMKNMSYCFGILGNYNGMLHIHNLMVQQLEMQQMDHSSLVGIYKYLLIMFSTVQYYTQCILDSYYIIDNKENIPNIAKNYQDHNIHLYKHINQMNLFSESKVDRLNKISHPYKLNTNIDKIDRQDYLKSYHQITHHYKDMNNLYYQNFYYLHTINNVQMIMNKFDMYMSMFDKFVYLLYHNIHYYIYKIMKV